MGSFFHGYFGRNSRGYDVTFYSFVLMSLFDDDSLLRGYNF